MCLRVLKESNKSRFDRYSRQKQSIDHIPYCLSGLSRAHFSENLSQNNLSRNPEKCRGGCLAKGWSSTTLATGATTNDRLLLVS